MPIGLKGNSDGSGAIQIGGSDAISISTGLNTTFAGTVTATGTVAGTTGTLYPIVSGTAVSATGTAIDFTSIPSWVKRITVMFSGVSTNGTSTVQVQLGAGAIDATSYSGAGGSYNQANATGAVANSTGFLIGNFALAANTVFGTLNLTLLGSNLWVCSGVFALGATTNILHSGGSKTLSGTLDRVRITTVNGTDAFDAGTINILYE